MQKSWRSFFLVNLVTQGAFAVYLAIVTVQNGVSGYLVPDGDRAAYVARVCELMGDEEKRREMAERALERSHFYSKENVARIWDGVLGD